MKTDTWMPLFIGDYLADTIGLTYAQHGAYLLAIMAYWRNGGPLPDESMVSVLCGISEPERGRVLCFFQQDGDVWRHKRVDDELAEAARKKELASRAGRASAAARKEPAHSTPVEARAEINHFVDANKMVGRKAKASSAKLTEHQRHLADSMERLLGNEWVNDAGKWIGRIKASPPMVDKVAGELGDMLRGGRVKKSPAACAEDLWKRFKK